MRTVGTNLTNDIESTVTTPRYLLVIDAGANVLRYSSGESITWNSNTYNTADIKVSPNFDNARSSCNITITDYSLTAQQVLLGADLASTTVTVYQTYRGTLSTNDVVEIYSGAVDEVNTAEGVVQISSSDVPDIFPKTFINSAAGFTDLNRSGTYTFPQGVVVIRRE